ncbi:MAG: N-acetylglucosamine-6-phosphate deacetylase [Clostridiales bacterium]|nr:N-acetylglucosamine-6-phosphate deacetylase [Clostridiales bacterium]
MIIKNGKIFTGKNFIDERHLIIEEQKISKITESLENNMFDIDANGCYVVPGLIDIHTHGLGGFDVNISSEINMDLLATTYIKKGTTSLLPTTVSQPIQKTFDLLDYCNNPKCHKAFIGVHLEAPYLNKDKLGAQNSSYIEIPSVSNFKKNFSSYLSAIKIISMAPELDKNYELSHFLKDKQIILSFGHTNSNAKEGKKAFSNGYKLATHLMNAMPSIHHRNVAITGMALLDDSVGVEIISDLLHVSEEMIKIIIKCKPLDTIYIISDSMSAAHLGDGEYELSNQKVVVKDNCARTLKGNLAGSLITMLDGVKNMVSIGIKLEHALQFATYNQAKLLNMTNQIGVIKEGNIANILILTKQLEIKHVIFQGKLII